MSEVKLYFATNRKHEGDNQWNPDSYEGEYSTSGRQNLRFGVLDLTVDDKTVQKHLQKKTHKLAGDGEGLSKYLTKQAKAKTKNNIKINALKEDVSEISNFENLTSTQTFENLKKEMENSSDVCVYIHGYNVDWEEAVGAALALQYTLNEEREKFPSKNKIVVFLFSWPSEGSMMPFAAYWSDRKSASGSGPAVGRAFLKLMLYFEWLYEQVKSKNTKLCRQKINLLCHSMGNYVLESSLQTIIEYNNTHRLPCLFNHIFLCSPDVDDDVLESNKPMGRIHELCQTLSVYFNRGDVAMHLADKTKGRPDRLGQSGIANEMSVHRKINQIDCSNIVGGAVEHSYYLWATVNDDISMSMHDVDIFDKMRKRKILARNSWELK